MQRLVELDAPEMIIQTDVENIANGWERLVQTGWSAAADPLPDALVEIVGMVIEPPADEE